MREKYCFFGKQNSEHSWCYRKKNPKHKLLSSRTYNNNILDYLSKDYDIIYVKINDDWEESFSNSNSLSIELPMKIIARRKD